MKKWKYLKMQKHIKIEEIHDSESYIYLMKTSLNGLSLYQKTKLVSQFTKSEVKVLEECVDNKIKELLATHNIIVYGNNETTYKLALQELKQCGYTLEIVDRYRNVQDLVIIGVYNGMTVVIEDDNSLCCAVEIKLNRRW